MKELRVKQIEPEARFFEAALGITEERATELVQVIYDLAKDESNMLFSEVMAQASYMAKHANELACLAAALGQLMCLTAIHDRKTAVRIMGEGLKTKVK